MYLTYFVTSFSMKLGSDRYAKSRNCKFSGVIKGWG